MATIANAAKQWTVPPDEHEFVRVNRNRIATWANLFDRTLLLRPATDASFVVNTTTLSEGPGYAQLSYVNILMYSLAILGPPYVVWRRRRDDPGVAVTMTFLWLATVYALVTTSLLEFGENQRFAFELGSLPLIAAVVVVVNATHDVVSRFGQTGDSNHTARRRVQPRPHR